MTSLTVQIPDDNPHIKIELTFDRIRELYLNQVKFLDDLISVIKEGDLDEFKDKFNEKFKDPGPTDLILINASFIEAAKAGQLEIVRYICLELENKDQLSWSLALKYAMTGNYLTVVSWLIDHFKLMIRISENKNPADLAVTVATLDSSIRMFFVYSANPALLDFHNEDHIAQATSKARSKV